MKHELKKGKKKKKNQNMSSFNTYETKNQKFKYVEKTGNSRDSENRERT